MKHLLLLVGVLFSSIHTNAQPGKDYPKSLANLEDFKTLLEEVESHRAERLISLDEFLKMSKEENVLILDSRSKHRYDRKHLKGAIHLNFSDFTQEALNDLIPPNEDVKILIYCNNNFMGVAVELEDFPTKISKPADPIPVTSEMPVREKRYTLALNIPTYINLYGYGYRNIFELDELININDSRLEFEGTEIE